MTKQPQEAIKIVSENRRARFDYHIISTFEAGVVLTGAEIKSVRNGTLSLGESFVRPDSDGLYLIQARIEPYKFNSDRSYDPLRKRKLLLNKREIAELVNGIEKKGLTIVPLKMYLKRGFAKIEIALAKGKSAPDKRENTKAREAKREIARAIKHS